MTLTLLIIAGYSSLAVATMVAVNQSCDWVIGFVAWASIGTGLLAAAVVGLAGT